MLLHNVHLNFNIVSCFEDFQMCILFAGAAELRNDSLKNIVFVFVPRQNYLLLAKFGVRSPLLCMP
jgi:hypothetical protein